MRRLTYCLIVSEALTNVHCSNWYVYKCTFSSSICFIDFYIKALLNENIIHLDWKPRNMIYTGHNNFPFAIIFKRDSYTSVTASSPTDIPLAKNVGFLEMLQSKLRSSIISAHFISYHLQYIVIKIIIIRINDNRQ